MRRRERTVLSEDRRTVSGRLAGRLLSRTKGLSPLPSAARRAPELPTLTVVVTNKCNLYEWRKVSNFMFCQCFRSYLCFYSWILETWQGHAVSMVIRAAKMRG